MILAGARQYSLEFRDRSTQMTDRPDDTDPKKRKMATGEPSGLCSAGLGYRCATTEIENEQSKTEYGKGVAVVQQSHSEGDQVRYWTHILRARFVSII